jgi:uncharacterized membrane protein
MRFAVAVLLILLLASCAAGVSYYGDVTVYVGSTGVSSVSSTTNHPQLSSQTTNALTSKKGGYWLFNMTLPEGDVFSDYAYEINLPEGASVNYVKASGQWRITSADGRIALHGAGSDGSLSILMQYQIVRENAADPSSMILAAAAFILLIAAGVFAYRLYRGKKPEGASIFQTHEGVLSERQKDILRIIFEAGKPVNQALICEKLDLPKSSVSRNVQTLEKLGLVKKTRVGMSTFLSLAEDKK